MKKIITQFEKFCKARGFTKKVVGDYAYRHKRHHNWILRLIGSTSEELVIVEIQPGIPSQEFRIPKENKSGGGHTQR